LAIAFAILLINSLFGKTLTFVTLISLSFTVSNMALALGTVMFN